MCRPGSMAASMMAFMMASMMPSLNEKEYRESSPESESIQNCKGNGSLRPFVIVDYVGTQDPNGTGTRLPIARGNGGAYSVLKNIKDWLRAPLDGGSPGPKQRLFISDRAALDNLKRMEDLAAAAAAATFTKERRTHGTGPGLAIACDEGGPYQWNKHTLARNDWRLRSDRAALDNLKNIAGLAAAGAFTTEWVEIGLPPSLAGFKLSALARVSEAANPGGATEVAANPGGATEVFLLDSGASFHAVGDDRILQGIWNFPFDMWATLPDNSPLRIIGIGNIEMNEFSIPNVFLVERLRNNLISVSQLDIGHGMCCCFHGGQCTVMIPGGEVVGGAILDNGMYQLRFLLV